MKGFSLIELIVAVFLMLVLSSLGLRYFSSQKKKVISTWAKAELTEMAKIMKMAKNTDGHYHQFLYKMGYRPKGKIYALTGTLADKFSPCCDQYPHPGSDPCRIGYRSGFSHYDCQTGLPSTALTNVQICDSPGYNLSCEKDADLIINFRKRPGGNPSCFPSSWCDCDAFSVAADMSLGNTAGVFLTLNQTGRMDICE